MRLTWGIPDYIVAVRHLLWTAQRGQRHALSIIRPVRDVVRNGLTVMKKTILAAVVIALFAISTGKQATATTLDLIFLLSVSAFQAAADYYDGLRAYDAGRFSAAVRHWKRSADTGDIKSQLRLAVQFEVGKGVPQNFIRAHLYYNLAAAQGSAPARRARDRLARRMTKTDIAQAQHLAATWRPGFVSRSKIPQTALRTPGTESDDMCYEGHANGLQ